ncbi:nucleotidyltransferase domain-containing protein [Candidatus Woesearchaeota archaeon]|nr:nucleotidyltransferase domain-containing protein [Candidatus Woesearchaeota archaeon]
MESKLVQKFGNGGHIVLPKEYVGKRIRFIAEPKTFEDIKGQALEILKPHLENISGVYLYGSYARNEQNIDSDVDILVISNKKISIASKPDDYSIASATLEEIEGMLRNNAVIILPIIKEAKTIVNPMILTKYKEYKFTRDNTSIFMESCRKIFELNKRGIELDFEIGSIVYSLILRIKSLLMVKLINNGLRYSKLQLFKFLQNNGISTLKITELYNIYSNEKKNIKVANSKVLESGDILKLLKIAEELLAEVEYAIK